MAARLSPTPPASTTAGHDSRRVIDGQLPVALPFTGGHDAGQGDDGRALRLILLDDAFAKVDEGTVAELMGLLVTLDLDFVMTGHALWGCFPQVPRLDVYEVRRSNGSSAVTTHVHWDGHSRHSAQHRVSGLPAGLRAYLSAPSLQPLWPVLRDRLERTGHAIRGAVTVDAGRRRRGPAQRPAGPAQCALGRPR